MQHFLWPHTYSSKPLHLVQPTHVSHPPDPGLWRAHPAITHSSLRCFHYLFVWHLISGPLLLFVHLFNLSHLSLCVSFDSCHPFGTMCTLMDRKKAGYKHTESSSNTVPLYCLGPVGHRVIIKKKEKKKRGWSGLGLWPCGVKQKLHLAWPGRVEAGIITITEWPEVMKRSEESSSGENCKKKSEGFSTTWVVEKKSFYWKKPPLFLKLLYFFLQLKLNFSLICFYLKFLATPEKRGRTCGFWFTCNQSNQCMCMTLVSAATSTHLR